MTTVEGGATQAWRPDFYPNIGRVSPHFHMAEAHDDH
jgi:hypothetical protein